MTSSDAISLLRALSKLISDGVDAIDQTCNELHLHFPSPDEPFTPINHTPHLNPQIIEAASTIVSAAAQITAIVRPAPMSIFTAALQFSVPAALRTAIVTNTVEILREAGPQGLHVKDIAAKNGTHPAKLGPVLRLLATEHIFKEVTPDVFANNRISSVLDTYKSVAEINANPQEKYVGISRIAAIVTHFTGEALKACAFMAEGVTQPGYALADDPTKTAFNIAFNTELGMYSWCELAENQERLRIFGLAMGNVKNVSDPQSLLQGFDWTTIPNGIVVDIGGGIGSQSLIVAREHPNIKFVIQDRPAVIEDAKKFWAESMPDALKSGRVILQVNDFFKDQPIKGADVYHMRMILHNWADSYCLQILKLLREAASPNSRLLIVDNIMSYACEDTTVAKDIPGGIGLVPPQPLLQNWGHANVVSYLINTQMMSLMNGTERTLAQLDSLLHKAGWRVDRIYRGPELASIHQQVLAVPL